MNDLIKDCEKCELNECINCERNWADIMFTKNNLIEKCIKTIKVWLESENFNISDFEELYQLLRRL